MWFVWVGGRILLPFVLDYNFARRVWGLCHRWLGVLVVSQIELKSNFDQFRMSRASKMINNVWNTIWVGVVSEI